MSWVEKRGMLIRDSNVLTCLLYHEVGLFDYSSRRVVRVFWERAGEVFRNEGTIFRKEGTIFRNEGTIFRNEGTIFRSWIRGREWAFWDFSGAARKNLFGYYVNRLDIMLTVYYKNTLFQSKISTFQYFSLFWHNKTTTSTSFKQQIHLTKSNIGSVGVKSWCPLGHSILGNRGRGRGLTPSPPLPLLATRLFFKIMERFVLRG